MCLIALALDEDPRFPLVVAANRDEFFCRPSSRLAWWTPVSDEPSILGGRDLDSGGTWMGLTAQGRLAMVTNVRDALDKEPDAPSRGRIVPDWLAARERVDRFWMRTVLSGHNGFNLIAADFAHGECWWASNRSRNPQRLEPGVYGLSNAGLDTPWPKVTSLKARLRAALQSRPSLDELTEALFAALADPTPAPEHQLPRTGVAPDLERQLSSAFIRMPDRRYGTRCSTLVITEASGHHPVTHVFERSFDVQAGTAVQRHTALKAWPPRADAAAAGRSAPTEPVMSPVSESTVQIDRPSLAAPAARRGRTALA
jgi:uncharacterized protein with NRDE domain